MLGDRSVGSGQTPSFRRLARAKKRCVANALALDPTPLFHPVLLVDCRLVGARENHHLAIIMPLARASERRVAKAQAL